MTRLVGRVVSGIGDLARWMRQYADAYQAATGVELVPGSLNVELDREYRFPNDRIRLVPDQAGVGVSLVPCLVEGQPAYLFRTDRTESGAGDHPRTVVEIVAQSHFREDLGLRDGDRVEIVVPPRNRDATVEDGDQPRTVSATVEIGAPAEVIFEFIADPSRQPQWDGNDNLADAPAGQRVHGVGDVFTMVLSKGSVRENHVVEFEEGRRVAWLPADPGQQPAGHLWRWELKPTGETSTRVTHTYDWSGLTDEDRFDRARWTTSSRLRASLLRLAELVTSR